MSDAFQEALAITLKFEGGYVTNPADPGGETHYGVTKKTALSHGYTGDMKTIPMDVVAAIYKKSYWEQPGFAQVATFLPALAQQLFDIGVNMGPVQAGKFLQESLNLLAGLNLTVDGKIGPATIEALTGVPAKQRVTLRQMVSALQANRYMGIVRDKPSQRVFLAGWMNRVGGGV